MRKGGAQGKGISFGWPPRSGGTPKIRHFRVARVVAQAKSPSGNPQDKFALIGMNSIKIWKIIHIPGSVIPKGKAPAFSFLIKTH